MDLKNPYILVFAIIQLVKAGTQCPLWHLKYKTSEHCVCCDSLNGLVKFDKDYIKIQDGHCITWNDETNATEVSLCLLTRLLNYDVCGKYGSYRIPTNISGSELNRMICGGYNRQGPYCKECIDGHGPAVFSDSLICASCSERKHLWILNLSVQLLTVTLMYLIVIVLQINATSSPLNNIITYCQLFINGLKYGSGLHRRFLCFVGKDVTDFLIAIFGIWNLDFLRVYTPPMCVSQSLKTINILLFDYIIALYPFVLTAVIFLCIKLHDRNFKIIILLSLPLKKLLTYFRINWNPKTSILTTFATFFILVYSKLLYVSVNFLFVIHPYNCQGIPGSTVLLYDPTVQFFHSEHIPYAIFALSIIFIFVLLPPLLLLLYPTRLFRKCLSCCGFQRWDILHPIMDVFQGWYKDGTEGTCDFRPLSALYMLIRVGFVFMILFLHIMDIKDDNLMEWIGPGLVHFGIGIMFFIVKPYKKQWMNRADGICLVFYGSLVLAQNYHYKIIYIFMIITRIGFSPIVIMSLILVYRCASVFRRGNSPSEESR